MWFAARGLASPSPTKSVNARGPGRVGKWICRGALVAVVLSVVSCALFHAMVAWWPYPAGIGKLPERSTEIDDRAGVVLAAFAASDGQWRRPLAEEQVSPHLLWAIIAVEDSRFYLHHGVDWKSAAAAAWHDLTHLSFRRGASTLTMQVQRLREPRSRTFWNKIEQAIRAEQLEKRQTKPEILIEYVNRAPFGGNLVGAGAASWRYFGRPCQQLSLAEAALLAGLPQSPNRLRPDGFPGRAQARRNHVLARMLACGFITQAQRDEAAAEPIHASWRLLPQDRPASDLPAADAALPSLLRIAGQRPGEVVRCSIDAGVQRQAALAARKHLRSLEVSGVSSAAVVVLDTQTSQCLAAVSLGDESDVAVDLTRRPHSTGSALKPFIYAAAFDAGICGPGTVLSDAPSTWPGYQPNDYDRLFRGKLSAAEALGESRNIPAMLVLAKLGVEPAIGVMDAAGLHGLAQSPGRYGLSLAVGGAEASAIEMAEAYAALGRGGTSAPIQFVPGESEPPAKERERQRTSAAVIFRCLRSDACWQVMAALSEGERTARVFPEALRSHVAWKTGTSSGHRDAWCAAVTYRRTVVVWLGNGRGGGSPCLVGQEAAAPLALRLIAMLDPVDEPWPVATNAAPAIWKQSSAPAAPLVMVSPADGQQVVLTTDLPRQRQRVALEADHRGEGNRAATLTWFVDEQPVGSCAETKRLWWEPTAGAHEIRVVDSGGRGASALVRVRVR